MNSKDFNKIFVTTEDKQRLIEIYHKFDNNKQDLFQHFFPAIQQEFEVEIEASDRERFRSWFKRVRRNLDLAYANVNYINPKESITPLLDSVKVERLKLQEERRQLNKYHNSFARTDLICEYITDAIKGIKPIQYKLQPKKYSQGNQSGVLLLSDGHYGQIITPDEVAPLRNEFNIKVFESRMWQLAERVIQLVDKERLDEIHVLQLGDELDGDSIFSTQAFSVEESVVEQLLHYAEFMSNWYAQLSQYVHLDIKSAQGNHTRIARKREDALKKNDFARIANHIIGLRLGDFPYVNFNPSTNDYIVDKVFTWNVLGLHGHQIGNIDNVIPQYSSMLKTLFDLVVMGHWHSPEERESNCAEVIVNGSLVGTNGFSMGIRKSSLPSQKFFIVDKDEGKMASWNIKLN